ncbi:MAG TPA: SAF domain-containing protein [Microthrixaceae bacterium]|nr:SAF domain-containing protein [Microthrixaceae bacterium]
MTATLKRFLAQLRILRPVQIRIDRVRFRLRGSSLARQIARRRAIHLVLAAAVALMVYSTLSSAESARSGWGETVSLAMTTAPLDAGDALSGSSLRMVDVPRSLAPDSALSELPVGRRARTPLDRGEILTAAKVTDQMSGPVASKLVDDAQAVTLPLGDAPAPLTPGDLVDVYGIVPDRSGSVVTSARMAVVARSAVVMELTDSAVTLAVAHGEVAPTVEGIAGGSLRIVITG